MFNQALAAYGTNVKGIRGTWIAGGTLADNFNAFKAATASGKMTPEEAALTQTFTGKMAQRAGFTNATVTKNTDRLVEVEFRR